MTWGRKGFTEKDLLDLGWTLKSTFYSKSSPQLQKKIQLWVDY